MTHIYHVQNIVSESKM